MNKDKYSWDFLLKEENRKIREEARKRLFENRKHHIILDEVEIHKMPMQKTPLNENETDEGELIKIKKPKSHHLGSGPQLRNRL